MGRAWDAVVGSLACPSLCVACQWDCQLSVQSVQLASGPLLVPEHPAASAADPKSSLGGFFTAKTSLSTAELLLSVLHGLSILLIRRPFQAFIPVQVNSGLFLEASILHPYVTGYPGQVSYLRSSLPRNICLLGLLSLAHMLSAKLHWLSVPAERLKIGLGPCQWITINQV